MSLLITFAIYFILKIYCDISAQDMLDTPENYFCPLYKNRLITLIFSVTQNFCLNRTLDKSMHKLKASLCHLHKEGQDASGVTYTEKI